MDLYTRNGDGSTSTLRNNPKSSLEETKEEMGGNICRCTGYQKIFEAVEIARDVINKKQNKNVFDKYYKPENSFIGANVKD